MSQTKHKTTEKIRMVIGLGLPIGVLFNVAIGGDPSINGILVSFMVLNMIIFGWKGLIEK